MRGVEFAAVCVQCECFCFAWASVGWPIENVLSVLVCWLFGTMQYGLRWPSADGHALLRFSCPRFRSPPLFYESLVIPLYYYFNFDQDMRASV